MAGRANAGKFRGKIRRSLLAGREWQLEGDDGQVYTLHLASLPPGIKEGDRARVTGTVNRGAMGIGMSGPILEVDKVEPEA